MRKDMSKIIVERPRTGGYGGQKGIKKKISQTPWEDLPVCESMKKGHDSWKLKELNENLRPLHRFLGKAVGRPWNDVYSEICENIKLSNTVQRHILEHLKYMVDRNTKMVDGVVCYFTPYAYYNGSSGWLPIDDKFDTASWTTYYVHPETGLLMAAKPRKRRKYHQKEDNDRKFSSDEWVQYERINGIWYMILLEPAVATQFQLKCGISPIYKYVTSSGVKANAKEKLQLNKRELKLFGLKNTPGN